MSNQRTKSGSIRRFIVSLLLIGLIAAIVSAILYRQVLFDTVSASSYKPTADEKILKEHLALTSTGSFYYDASQTNLSDATNFNTHCPQREANSPILGCYVGQRIYVYDIRSSELEGIRETTAAHEMLHAAYERLDSTTKEHINTLLLQEYEKVKTPELEERMNYYKKNQPGDEVNELHSILGTEQPNLSPELEEYYKKYFTNRSKITSYHAAYNAVFTSTISRINALQTQINSSVESINKEINTYNDESAKLNSDISSFNQQASNLDESSSSDSFSTDRQSLVVRQNRLAADRSSINQAIDNVKTLRAEYDQLVSHYTQLNESINSEIAPTPSIK